MPLPRIDSNIANVSMDYFLRGVDAAKPQGAPLLPGDNPPAAPEEHPAGKLVTQLDVLLMKAATASTKSLDGRTIRQTFQKLVDDGALDRNSLKLLAKTADAAAKTLKALDKFTGRELAGAFGADGRLDETSKAGKAVAAAVRAQQNLSDLFAQLGKSLHAMSRHEDQMRAANPQFRGVDAALLNEVDDMRQLCDRRATEINHLAYQMKDFAVHLAANGENADPNVATILKTKVAERTLGAGVAGTVLELTRTDGTSVVFKGETESRTGLSHIAAGSRETYASGQQTVNLNISAKKAAVALGMGDMIVDYSAGTHKGVFGFFMEKAKGMTAHSFAKGGSSSSPDAGMSLKQIKRLSPGQRLQLKADLMREMNRLQWLDLVTGQADRHWENYFIHVDPETRKVSIKGIDNDAGYSQFRTGATKFSFDAGHSALFKSQLKKLAREIDSRNADAVYDRLLADPGIRTDAKGQITVDASRLGDKSIVHPLSRVTGTQSLAIPDKIDRETYNAFLALKAGPQREAYLNSIRPRLSKASYDAAVSRLDDVIAHIEQLPANRIVENQNGRNGWLDADEAPLGTGKVTVQKNDGREKRIGGEIATDVNEQLCPSYFARDGIDKLFA